MHNPRSIFTAPRDFSKKPTDSPTLPHAPPLIRRRSTPDSQAGLKRPDGLDVTRLPPNILSRRHSSITQSSQSIVERQSWGPQEFSSPLANREAAITPPRPSPTARASPRASSRASPRTPRTSGTKRSLATALGAEVKEPHSEPSQKSKRIGPLPRHTLNRFSFSDLTGRDHEPPSPLFFSHSPRPRPALPPRFSSSEAAASMLTKAKEETGMKTVHLARGKLSGSSPASVAPRYSVERASVDRTSTPTTMTSDTTTEQEDATRLLSHIGISELLEQDERPTFIVDLKDSRNLSLGQLQIVFANSSLRTSSGMLELVLGKDEHDSGSSNGSTGSSWAQFRTWLLSAANQGESLNVSLPSIKFAGISWSCSTLRKRLRIVSGRYAATIPSNDIPAQTSRGETSAASLEQSDASAMATTSKIETGNNEPSDYFGNVAPPATGDSTLTLPENNEVAPSIEVSGAPPLDVLNGVKSKSDSEISDTLESTPSAFNEYVLRAATAGSVDDFHSPERRGGFFDWTQLPDSADLPQHVQFARSVDWASTSLGPMETWSPDLRQMSNLIMASPHPAAMYWGKDLVAIYNEAYILLAGQKHPKLMGQPYSEAWAEIWDEVKDVFASARTTGEATMKDDDCLFIKRSDYLEETYFSWSIIPMVGGDGTVMGLYNPAFEKTRRKIAERRMLTLREVGERTATARDIKTFWLQVLEALKYNEFDTPFVLLYSVLDEPDSDSASMNSSSLFGTRQCVLEGTLGVPEGHLSAPSQIDLKSGMEGFGPVFREITKTGRPVVLDIGSGDLPDELLEGIDNRGFGDPCRSAVVCPIQPTTQEVTLGFLVVGVNPRRPYDDDYSLFIGLLSRQLATSLASVVLFEEEIKRGQKAAKLAALDRIELSEQLAARTQEAIESETKFTRMAEFAPVGMFIADSEGHLTYCNDTWYEITRVAKNPESTDQWINAIKTEDQERARGLWHKVVDKVEPNTAEFRFKAPWEDPSGNLTDTWVLFSAYPERYIEGGLKSVFGSITNISQQKWAEGFQKRKMEEAVELKRQQENFIDITSHEMRNPLSAILQCADEISSSLQEARNTDPESLDPELISNNIDAAQTIALCAQHQKRIVDDVLTLSKLDSALLLVTPVDAQPLAVVQRALKMFEGELQTADIQMRFVVDDSYRSLGLDWVRMDPSRVLQVLINLITNAVKFTTTQSQRTIVVRIAASRSPPTHRTIDENDLDNVNYFPSRSKGADTMQGSDWGSGEDVCIHFAVRDTGRGLTPEEKKLLFMRFSQASPRTHVQYGGSGLGLFISRELTELQGGEIGVASESGTGSTFAFYIKARQSTAPDVDDLHQHLAGATLARTASDPKARAVQQAAAAKGSALAPPKTRDFAHSPSASPGRRGEEKTGGGKATADRAREPLRVLIVEDNLVNQRVLQKQLRNLGCETYVANHGGEALDRLKDSTYWRDSKGHQSGSGNKKARAKAEEPIEISVVLMDQEMPVMDGLTCTRRIRELEEMGELVRHVPIIAVTANARSEQIQTAMTAGMVSGTLYFR
ncbi:hypothetical protein EV356DRAFT_82045 [Viridothelium virens]|uniref:Uncharacterized protein n=1 Tax=Viridothelium virens TaxID=1048519 RepID=A0A6A6HDF9_VIRVR|nr:hypothetical protein EV356DRAFT_82045 [Viridothelium virens]